MRDYVTACLNDICTITMGQSPPSSAYNSKQKGLPFFQGKAEFTELHPVTVKWCTESNKIAYANDILLSVRAPVGTTNIADQKCCIGRGLAALRYIHCYKFLFYYLRLIEKKLDEKGTGTTFRAISGDVLRNYPINLPPLPEQRAIVAKLEQLFSELDNGIACLKKAQEQLKVYRQAVLKQAFEGELTKAWREQQTSLPSAQELLENITNKREQAAKHQGKKLKPVIPLTQAELVALPILPKEWKWVRIRDIAQKIQIGPFGSQLHSDDYTENGIPLINPKHIKNQTLSPRVSISIDKANSLPQYFLKENDIIVGRRGEMGRTAPVLKTHAGWFCGTGSLYIRLGQSFISKLYSLILSERRIVDYLEKMSRGTTMANLNSQIINSLPIQLISPQEQSQIVQEIETRLSVCDNMEATIKESLEKAEALRQSILKKAFEGKLLSEEELQITRNAPDWEPAEKLLERIRAEKRTAR